MFTKLMRNPFFAILTLLVCSPIVGFGIVLFWLLTTVGSVLIWVLVWPFRILSGLALSILGGGR